MKNKLKHIGERIADEYCGVCNLALFFVVGTVSWMETIALVRFIGESILF